MPKRLPEAFVGLGLDERETELDRRASPRRSSELTRLLADLRAKRLGDKLGDELASTLTSSEEGTTRHQTLRLVDAIVSNADDDAIEQVASRLPVDALTGAWTTTMVVLAGSVRARQKLTGQAKRQEREAMTRIAGRLQLPFQAIESYLFGYFRLRQILAEAGWDRVAPHLGEELARPKLDAERYEIRGDNDQGETFVVRSLGISVFDQPVHRAIVEALRQPEARERSTDRDTEPEH